MTGKQYPIIIVCAVVTALITVVVLKLLGVEGAGMYGGGVGGGVAGAVVGRLAAKSKKSEG